MNIVEFFELYPNMKTLKIKKEKKNLFWYLEDQTCKKKFFKSTQKKSKVIFSDVLGHEVQIS